MTHKNTSLKTLTLALFLLIASTVGFSILHKDTISALDNNFVDGITVDSTLDTPDSDLNDTVCDDGNGNCTLRAAIQVANSSPDTSTILIQYPGNS